MKTKKSSESLALNDWEREESHKKMIEINEKLKEKSMREITKESQILHKIIEIGLSRIDLSEDGSIIIK